MNTKFRFISKNNNKAFNDVSRDDTKNRDPSAKITPGKA